MKLKTLTVAAFLGTAILAAPVSASTVNLLTNGSFEEDSGSTGLRGIEFSDLDGNPGRRNWDIYESLPGWYSTIGDGIEIQTNDTLGFDAQDGNHYVELDSNNNSNAMQDVVLAAGSYELSFWYSPRTGNDQSNGVEFGVFGAGGFSQSDEIFGPTDGFPRLEWTQVSFRFDVDADQLFTVFFEGTGASDSVGGLIDNVSIAAVPLPASSLLLLAGLGGLAAMRRRKTA